MFIFTLKETGETIVLPTPSGGQVDIDALPCGEPFTKEQVKEYFEWKKKQKKKK